MMKRKAPRSISCTCCGGGGRVPFTGEYADTLDFIEDNYSLGADFTGAELGRRLGIPATAMISTPWGRKRLYKLAE